MRAPSRTVRQARQLRREMSLPEVLLWRELRRRAVAGLQFRRQHPVGPFVLDFYCASARLAVEVEGAAHDDPERAERDARRRARLAERGIRVLRVPAREVLDREGLQSVLDTIAAIRRGDA